MELRKLAKAHSKPLNLTTHTCLIQTSSLGAHNMHLQTSKHKRVGVDLGSVWMVFYASKETQVSSAQLFYDTQQSHLSCCKILPIINSKLWSMLSLHQAFLLAAKCYRRTKKWVNSVDSKSQVQLGLGHTNQIHLVSSATALQNTFRVSTLGAQHKKILPSLPAACDIIQHLTTPLPR